jgi:hypothetical protein
MSTKKTTIQKSETSERHLIKAAEVLIKGFKTPEKFLFFLTQALYWIGIEGVSEEKGADQTFFLRIILNEVLQQWISNNERVNEKIAVGLKEVKDCFGYKEYNEQMTIILKGLGASIQDGCPFKKYLDEYFKGITIMLEVGQYIQAYEYEIHNIREQKKAA